MGMPGLTRGVADQRYAPLNNTPFGLKPSHLFRTHAKLAGVRGGTGTLKIAALGHSMLAGVGATPGVSDWPNQLKAQLVAAGYPSAGTGLVVCSHSTTTLASVTDSRWSFGAGWSTYNANSNMATNSTNSNAATFTSDVAGTRVDVYYFNTSGPFTVTIDGGSAVAVPAAGATDAMSIYSVTGLANTAHTVAIARTSGNVLILGVEVWNNTSGIRLANFGIASVKAVSLASTNHFYPTPIAATNSEWGADLALVECTTNDVSGTAISTWSGQMQTCITALKANAADVVLVAEQQVGDRDATAYVAALYALARTNDVPLVDFSRRWTSYTLANSYGLMFDQIHPTAAGYADQARAVMLSLGL